MVEQRETELGMLRSIYMYEFPSPMGRTVWVLHQVIDAIDQFHHFYAIGLVFEYHTYDGYLGWKLALLSYEENKIFSSKKHPSNIYVGKQWYDVMSALP